MRFPFCTLVLVEVFKGGLNQRLRSELPLWGMPAGSGGLRVAQLPRHLWYKLQILLPNIYICVYISIYILYGLMPVALLWLPEWPSV